MRTRAVALGLGCCALAVSIAAAVPDGAASSSLSSDTTSSAATAHAEALTAVLKEDAESKAAALNRRWGRRRTEEQGVDAAVVKQHDADVVLAGDLTVAGVTCGDVRKSFAATIVKLADVASDAVSVTCFAEDTLRATRRLLREITRLPNEAEKKQAWSQLEWRRRLESKSVVVKYEVKTTRSREVLKLLEEAVTTTFKSTVVEEQSLPEVKRALASEGSYSYSYNNTADLIPDDFGSYSYTTNNTNDDFLYVLGSYSYSYFVLRPSYSPTPIPTYAPSPAPTVTPSYTPTAAPTVFLAPFPVTVSVEVERSITDCDDFENNNEADIYAEAALLLFSEGVVGDPSKVTVTASCVYNWGSPTRAPVDFRAPTSKPTARPSFRPIPQPTSPTPKPSVRPTPDPTVSPLPSVSPSFFPTNPTHEPTLQPTFSSVPTPRPSYLPTTASPSISPIPTTASPSLTPHPTTLQPTTSEPSTAEPSVSPIPTTATPTTLYAPSLFPTTFYAPSPAPSTAEPSTAIPSFKPTVSLKPTGTPTGTPTRLYEPTSKPTHAPTRKPTPAPSTATPTTLYKPTSAPTTLYEPTSAPTTLEPTFFYRPTPRPTAVAAASAASSGFLRHRRGRRRRLLEAEGGRTSIIVELSYDAARDFFGRTPEDVALLASSRLSDALSTGELLDTLEDEADARGARLGDQGILSVEDGTVTVVGAPTSAPTSLNCYCLIGNPDKTVSGNVTCVIVCQPDR